MMVPDHHSVLGTRLKRREFLSTTARVTAGMAGILVAKTPPIYAATRTLTMMTWNHFVSASDDILRRTAREFGRANRCQVKIDFIPHRDTYVKVAKEQETRKGHDIVFLFFSKPRLHHQDLATLDFVDALGRELGGWYDLARDACQVESRWVALPWYYIGGPMTYREDLYQKHGFAVPTTWETWKETGKKIKETSGEKVGIALSQTEDASFSHYVLLWAHGASTVDKESQVAINSPGTRLALDYMKDLYESCMTNEVLSWDDSSNNQAFLGGKYSWVHNGVSIYFVAKNKAPDIAKVMNHALTPSGPGGQHSGAVPINYGIWKFAEQKELAKEFLQHLMNPGLLEEMFHATLTYNSPTFKNGEHFDWGKDPKTAQLKNYGKTAHLVGWPGPADHRSERARAEWIVPNMFTFYVTGKKSLEESVSWGEGELKRIYEA